jgi:tetratricopeptide (TPR) repeat protein
MAARFALGFALALAVTTTGAPARAEHASAAAAFDEGLAHYRRKAFSEAAQAFLRAYRLEPSADAAFNAGLAWQLAGRSAWAATAYEVALARGLDPSAERDARERLQKLAPEVGRIEVSAPDGAKVEAPPFVLDASHATFYLEPGKAKVTVTLRDGTRRIKRVAAEAGKTVLLLVEEPSATSRAPEPPTPPPTRESAAGPYATLGWVALGVAAAATGAAAYLGVKALGARDDYNASRHRDADARSRAEDLRTATNVAWVVAGVSAGAGLGLLLLAPEHGAPGGSRGLRGLTVSGRFR